MVPSGKDPQKTIGKRQNLEDDWMKTKLLPKPISSKEKPSVLFSAFSSTMQLWQNCCYCSVHTTLFKYQLDSQSIPVFLLCHLLRLLMAKWCSCFLVLSELKGSWLVKEEKKKTDWKRPSSEINTQSWNLSDPAALHDAVSGVLFIFMLQNLEYLTVPPALWILIRSS